MANSLRSDFHADLASTILNDIQYQRANYYYFLGKIEPWEAGDEVAVNNTSDSEYENTKIRSNIVFLKRILPNDVTLVAKKYAWAANTIYTTWDDRAIMNGQNFYCITSDNNVYKCLDNNDGTASYVMPTSKSYYAFKTNDGYTWKYMYNVPSFKSARFASALYLPVQRALSDSFYNKGSVEDVAVVDGGSGYTDNPLTYITVTPNITGENAVLVPSISEQDVLGPDGLTIIRPAGSIVGITIVNGGINYATPPTLTVVDTLSAGSGIYGNASAKLKAVVFGGSIVNVTIEDPGTGYSAASSTSVVVTGNGIGAAFTPIIYGGSIIDVVVENVGSGYTDIGLIVTGVGTGAQLQPVFAASDYISDQSIVEQTTQPGGIYSVSIVNSGINYSLETTATVVGDGTGCTVTPVIGIGGVITKIVIDTFGTGYTEATIVISDLIGSGFSANVVITPINGHGKDAIVELFGETLAINTSIRFDEFLNKLSQDYRQFGIIKNPTNLITGKTFRENSNILAYECVFNHITGLDTLLAQGIEDILTLNGVEFRVISVTGLNVLLQPIGQRYLVPSGSLTSTTSNTVYTCNSIINSPTANKYSGKLLYVSDENPFAVSEEQGIIIKTYLNF